MKRYAAWTLGLAVVFGLIAGGCTTTLPQQDMSADALVQEARKSVREITVAEAKEILDKGDYLFLDCREPKEYKMGHVPGAMNLPRGLLEFKIDKKVSNKNENMVVYCKTGGRACLSACTLCRMGYKNVKNMAGGWNAWETAGYPID